MKKFIPYFLLFALLHISSYSQDTFIRLEPITEDAKPNITKTAPVDPDLAALFALNNVSSYIHVYPGAKTPAIQHLHNIYCNSPNIDLFIQELNNSGQFTNISKEIVGGLASCPTPVTINDPFYIPSEWYYDPPWHLEMVDAYCAWSITKGDSNFIAGVVDSEFDPTHEDMIGKFAYIYETSPTPLIVECFHGTKVASMVASNNNNGIGTAGIGYDIKVGAYRAGCHYTEPFIWQAYLDGRKVINVSYHYTGLTVEAAKEITQNGTVLVISAGNSIGTDFHTDIANIPGVILVGSVNYERKAEPPKHSVNEYVDIFAPGLLVSSATADPALGYYSRSSGTSIAAPFVTGAISLMLSVNPCLTPPQIEHILKVTSTPLADAASFPTLTPGTGILNVYEAVKMAAAYNTTQNITANTTWAGDHLIGGDIIVKSGKTLTITGNVKMLCESRILVEKGAKLLVDGGRITTALNNSKWKGIELMGDKNQPSLAMHQGTVELKNNAVIEHAHNGIRNFTWDNGAQGGGIILAKNSSFINCRRGVELNDYPNYTYMLTGGNSNCSIDGVSFLIDENYVTPTTGSRPNFISSWNVMGGVKIVNSTFKVTQPYEDIPPAKRGNSIQFLTTGAIIQNNTFEGTTMGIYSLGYSGTPTRSTKIYNNKFDFISENILLGGDAITDIRNNKIKNMLHYVAGRPPVGIYTNQSINTLIQCGNDISGISTGLGSTMYKLGIVANHTNAYATLISGNHIHDIHYGIQTQGNNPHLSMVCNHFDNITDVAMHINPLSSTGSPHYLNNQGTGTGHSAFRAENKFTNTNYSIRAYSLPHAFNYYYNSAYTDQIPINAVGNVNTINAQPVMGDIETNSQCNTLFSCYYATDWVISAPERGTFLSAYSSMVASGQKQSPEARRLFHYIITAFNDVQDKPGLISFLENDMEVSSNKLLIPLYIETGQTAMAISKINGLPLSNPEKNAYLSYYQFLIDLKTSNRTIYEITPNEKTVLQNTAANDYEVSAFAKALLEFVYDEPWEHPIDVAAQLRDEVTEPKSLLPVALVTQLGDAYPNPARHTVSIKVFIAEQDEQDQPQLIIKDIRGKIVMTRALNKGNNQVQINLSELPIPSGIYFYTLATAKHNNIATKKFTILQ